MGLPVQGYNRGELRRSIARSLGIMQTGEATSTVDSSSLIDTLYLRGADDEHNGKQVKIYDAVGSIVDGEESFVSDYTGGATCDATCAPVFTASIADGDKYELWKTPWLVTDVHDAIDQAILKASARCLQNKQTEAAFTKPSTYLYDCLGGFKAIHMVEYEYSIGEAVEIDTCDEAWTAGANATVTADTEHYIEGSASNKIVVASGASTTEVLAYKAISSKDLSGCDKLEVSIYSTVALTAGYLQIRLDDTALGASVLESLDIPATSANTWTRHIISLANPLSDTAIIYVDLYQVTDVGACTVNLDYIRAVDSKSRNYVELNPEQWSIVRASTPLLQLSSSGLGVTGSPKLLRISGYDLPDMLSDDTTDSEIDPDYIINMAKGLLMTGHAKSRTLDVEDREGKGQKFIALAMQRLNSSSSGVAANVRYL